MEMIAREPRKSVMLAATIEASGESVPVRIRNMSSAGAMVDGASLPEPGLRITLRRLQMAASAVTVWSSDGRCGLQLAETVDPDEWVAGAPKASKSACVVQARIDGVQAALRSGSALPEETTAEAPDQLAAHEIDLRIADELSHLYRMIEGVVDALSEDVDVLMRHQKTLQNADIARAILEALERVVRAEDRASAIAAIDMHDMRSRMSGQQTLT